MCKKITTKKFIERANLIHSNKYDYSKVNYTHSQEKVIIICPIHGEFTQTAGSHIIKNAGCRLCGREISRSKHILSTKDFIKRAIGVHGEKYDYTSTKYINNKTKVKIICPIHGEFEQMPKAHLRGQNCSKCADQTLTTSEFIKKALKIHNKKYMYEKVEYKNNSTKVLITCLIHGTFEQRANSHLNGKGCPSCAIYGFDANKPGYLYYLKVTTNDGQILYKIGIINKSVNERFQLNDLRKIEIIKQKLYENGQDALNWETKLKRKYRKYQYKGPNILSSGNTELFTEDIMALWYK